MKILLDTHTLIWFLEGNEKLGRRNKSILENPNNTKYLSIVSIWDLALKINSGKLQITKPLQYFIPKEINLISLKLEHIFHLKKLPYIHKDPFDRLIISTAIFEKLTLISIDENFKKYEVNLVWEE